MSPKFINVNNLLKWTWLPNTWLLHHFSFSSCSGWICQINANQNDPTTRQTPMLIWPIKSQKATMTHFSWWCKMHWKTMSESDDPLKPAWWPPIGLVCAPYLTETTTVVPCKTGKYSKNLFKPSYLVVIIICLKSHYVHSWILVWIT